MLKLILILIFIIVAIAVLSPIISLIVHSIYTRKVKKEVKDLFKNAKGNKIISNEDLQTLPTCVQKWLINSNVVGKEEIYSVYIKQYAKMRLRDNKAWFPTFANQYFNVSEPGFVWNATIRIAPFFNIIARDKFHEGKGNMLIKFLLFTLADIKGDKLDQGTYLRYLAEIVWFPTAALSKYITWEEVDSYRAKATLLYKGVSVTGLFVFNEKYDVKNFIALRYMENKGQFSLERWSTPIKEYCTYNGIKIPSKGEVIWHLKEGDFCWYKYEIREVIYNEAKKVIHPLKVTGTDLI